MKAIISALTTLLMTTFISPQSWATEAPTQDLRKEFARIIQTQALPRAQEMAKNSLDPESSAIFLRSLVDFQKSFEAFIEALCLKNTNTSCRTARYTEGIELAKNMTFIPDVSSDQLVLPTRPFQRADEGCSFTSTQIDPDCMSDTLHNLENRLLQTRDESLAELGIQMAQDYSNFAKYLPAEQSRDFRYQWNYDYALHYVEDRLSDY